MVKILKKRVKRNHEVITGMMRTWIGATFYTVEIRFELIIITYIVDMTIRAFTTFQSRYANYQSAKKSYKTLMVMV